jgi:predicted enzyme related to lactoylglutathione lyase
MAGFASLIMVNLDTDNPPAMATFYAALLGWDVTASEDAYSMISDGSTSIGFGLVDSYEGPGWPQEKAPKRYHLDFYVDDLDDAEAQAIALGATKVAEQPDAAKWRVLLDPSGQPFDLCPRPAG